jgi:hypothetical protein
VKVLGTVESDVFALPLCSNQNLLNFKSLLARRFSDETKTGVVTTSNPVGRGVQSLASAVIPGNQSTVRHPVRSAIYSAITPGGRNERNNRNLIGPSIGRGGDGPLRCPSGFENGGRFATRNFGNCGRRLFNPTGPTGGRSGGGRGAGNVRVLGTLRREGEALGAAASESRIVQVQRNAQIPRTGAANASKYEQSLNSAISALSNPDTNGSLVVRRDGYTLESAVGLATLATITDNPDMADAALVASVASPSEIGSEGVPTLWKGGVRQVTYALPGGGSLSLRRNGQLTAADKRRMTRAWARSSSRSDGDFDYGLRLRDFAEETDGKIDYVENFPNIDGPNDVIAISRSGKTTESASVQRWVYSTYLAEGAPGRDPETVPWIEADQLSDNVPVNTTTIKDVPDAVKHLDSGGSPEEVPADLLAGALESTKAFQKTQMRSGVSLLERADGKKWFEVKSPAIFSHLGEKVSSDVQAGLGLEAPAVKFIGVGANRDFLVAHPGNGETGQLKRRPIDRMNPSDLLRTIVADWLVDTRDRSVTSLVSAGSGSRSKVIPSSNLASGLGGLSGEELTKRRNLVLGDFMSQSLNSAAADRYRSLALTQRKILLDLYADLLKRASDFNWDDYTSRLGLDGELSAGEKAHLELLKRLYERRLSQLRSSRKRFLSGMGIS